MTDLTAFEQRLADHLSAEAPIRAPEHLVKGILATTRATSQRRRLSDRTSDLRRNRANGRLLAIAATLALVAVGVTAVMSGAIPRRPDVSPIPSAGPTPSPAASPASPSGFLPFTSQLHGYSIEYPAAWTASAATTSWSDEDLWAGPWFFTSREIADVFDGPGAWRLEVVATDVPEGVDASGFVDSGVLDRPQMAETSGCRIRSNMWVALPRDGRWRDSTIGGVPGLLRRSCGIFDGVTIVSGRAYIFSLTTVAGFAYQPGGPTFAELMETVVFEAPPTDVSASFTSPVYRYTVAVPAGCSITAATGAWASPAAWEGTGADIFRCDDGRDYVVAAARVPGGMSPEAWVAALPRRTEGTMCVKRLAGSTTMVEAYRPEFTEEPIAGNPGWVRAACGYVDGVVVLDRVAYVFTLHGSFAAGGDLYAFDRFAGSTTLAPDGPRSLSEPILGPTETLTSGVYGVSIAYPVGWTPTPATARWSGEGRWYSTAAADVIRSPERGSGAAVLRVVAIDVPAGPDLAAWIVSDLPDRPELEDYAGRRQCVSRSPSGAWQAWTDPWPLSWLDASVDGRPALTRDACGFSDAVVLVDRTIYVFSLATRYEPEHLLAGPAIGPLLASVRFDVAGVPTATAAPDT